MKYCELCKGLARTYCESDQASLCWNCDVKVHGANFLVARHSRTVLCHACQSPTPWKASGAELGVTVSDRLDRTSPKRKYSSQAVWSGGDGGDASAESRPLKAFRAETKFPGQTQPGLRTESVVESVREFRRLDTRNLSG
ncbi:hypothetical protein TIFTF001_030332 [Ficus carica]|uniref:B box-type domain-containing protein n=1 Tax=Ficus carica TaxID=3494 RepID=A0AA88DT51_FICCA|nr:hypothetical protein TIFTF001_030332 [Ficus carica]